MVGVLTGLWSDYSQPAALRMTLTLPVNQSNYLLSALAVLVTLSAASFWNITAFVLHHYKSKNQAPDDVDLQHRVLLRNSGGAMASIVQLLKIQLAWSKKRGTSVLGRTLGLVIPPVAILLVFSVASIMTSRVANNSYDGILARASPDSCGVLRVNDRKDIESMRWKFFKAQNDSVRARAYVRDFYFGSLASGHLQSNFPRAVLSYSEAITTTCPFPNTTRCSDPRGAISFTTKLMNSHDVLGINAPPENRIEVEATMTCSPINANDLVRIETYKGDQWVEFFMGPVNNTNKPYTFAADMDGGTTLKSYDL
jgi:hypothetical protein